MKRDTFLAEIGTEELPPKALRDLEAAFVGGIVEGLAEHRLSHGAVRPFATPRRLAVVIEDVPERQEDLETERRGPPVSVAYGDDGKPGPAALAFAKKCGVDVSDLGREATDKGEWLTCRTVDEGRAFQVLAAEIVANALANLPVPRPMRWGSGDVEFVRPAHWLVLMHGGDVLEGEVLGLAAGRETCGHRFHAPGPLEIDNAADYAERLERDGRVLPALTDRLARIREAVEASARDLGGRAVADAALYEEVASLVEWPVPVTGSFDDEYLELPPEVVRATLTNHQRYFPLAGDDGALLARFVTIANLESTDPSRVREGNERVIRPRLADAAFFWKTDRQQPLAARLEGLGQVVYQKGLGSIADKARRVSALATQLAERLGGDAAVVARAGLLCKADLLTGMVGEFPELQGVMGGYYARESGEPDAVADAIGDHYRPAFSGDRIPATDAARLLALADKLDTLAGAFALGKRPSGNRDPFGLRRAALGVVRIVVEGEFEVDLVEMIGAALDAQPVESAAGTAEALRDFILERLRSFLLEAPDASAEMFEAVRDRQPHSLLDFAARVRALAGFVKLEEAAALAAANKRIGNLLRKASDDTGSPVDEALFDDPAENRLHEALIAAAEDLEPLLENKSYVAALERLAALSDPVDGYFDDVMVMADDPAVRRNRLAMLATLRQQFLRIADISRLAIR